jgi:hypothetical protein
MSIGGPSEIHYGRGEDRLRQLTAEADADRVVAQTGYQPLLSRLANRVRRLLFGHREKRRYGDG